MLAGITDQVVYMVHESTPEDTDTVTVTSDTSTTTTTDEREGLLTLNKDDLITEVIKLRGELQEATSLQSELKQLCNSIASKRDAFVEALGFIDTLTATINSIQSKATRTIACSAIPHHIDLECIGTGETKKTENTNIIFG